MKRISIYVYRWIIYTIFVLGLGVLNIYSNHENITNIMIILLSISSFIIYLIYDFQLKKNNGIGGIIIFMIAIFSIIEMIRSHFSIDAIRYFSNYLVLLLYFPLSKLIENDSKWLKKIYIIGLVFSLFRCVCWLVYNFLHYDISPGLFQIMGYNWMRNGLVRLPDIYLSGYIFVYSICRYMEIHELRTKLKYLFVLFYQFFYASFVYGSRSQVISYMITLLIICIFKNNKSKKNIINLTLIIIVLILFFKSNIFKQFLYSFSIYNPDYGAGTQVRLYGFELGKNQWEKNIWLGSGNFLDENYYLFFKYYLSDLGIIRTLFQLGIIGFFLLILPFINGLFVSINNLIKNRKEGLFLLGLTIYILVSSLISQNIYDSLRILLVPIYMSIVYLVRKGIKL